MKTVITTYVDKKGVGRMLQCSACQPSFLLQVIGPDIELILYSLAVPDGHDPIRLRTAESNRNTI